jgi:hypothetical protein
VENFDSYTAGLKVACQNPNLWTTWTNAPCGSEDSYISNNYAYSDSNSLVISVGNDLVKDFGTAFTTGKYKISFKAYIPSGKDGYFNTLATFSGVNSKWGMECSFTSAGICSVFAGSTTVNVPSTYPVATWFPVEIIVDLGNDQAQLSINDSLVTNWQWTLGAQGSGVPLTLDANDFYGANTTNELYIDDYVLQNLTPVSADPQVTALVEFALHQNYPNPFNPSTMIQYAIDSRQFVSLKVYDILGKEIATLVNEEKSAGDYEVEFQSSMGSHQLASGIYFYRLQSGKYVDMKKMLLLK